MSKEDDSGPGGEELQTNEQATVESSSTESDELQNLMQPEADDVQVQSLNDKALAAAEQAAAAGQSAIDDLENDPDQEVVEPDAPGNEPSWILRGMLLLNLALMGVMLALPSAQNGKPLDVGEGQQNSQDSNLDQSLGDPFVSPRPQQAAIFGDAWNRANQLAGRGDFAAAVALLSEHLDGDGAREPSFIKEQVYRNLSTYSFRLGNLAEAAKYDSLADALTNQSKLPIQLIREAEEAEAMGNARLMRQAYARLLLIQSQVPPTQFNRISEAYLKLADSFRLEAKRGEARNK